MLQQLIEQMLQRDPEKRPSVEQIMAMDKIKQRIQERKVREEYNAIKIKESEL